jgi:Lrp/AsnC family transcriptional regulator, regulator for asnA, asnC and gidA
MRTQGLDEVDRKIIEHLQQDGRKPYTEIAASVGVSEGTIRYRTVKLLEAGVLRIVAIPDALKLGFQLMASIGVRVEPKQLDKVADIVAELNEVTYVAYSTGTFDLVLEVVLEDTKKLLDFISNTLYQIDGVREAETSLILKVRKISYKLSTH